MRVMQTAWEGLVTAIVVTFDRLARVVDRFNQWLQWPATVLIFVTAVIMLVRFPSSIIAAGVILLLGVVNVVLLIRRDVLSKRRTR